jgi:DNA-binding response OmpR family regulator
VKIIKDVKRIMIVDDEPDFRAMLDIIMKNKGYDTEMAVDGSDFLEKIDSFNPDIVTLDVMMPGLTIWEILGRLKGKKSNPKIILVTVVRFTEEEKKSLYEAANVVGYIKKPFDIDDIMDVVKKFVSRT